jgi:hypothetical protein
VTSEGERRVTTANAATAFGDAAAGTASCVCARERSLNFAELKRYIEQQKQIIVYYEEAVKPKDVVSNTSE